MDQPQPSCKEQLRNICIQQLQKLHWNTVLLKKPNI